MGMRRGGVAGGGGGGVRTGKKSREEREGSVAWKKTIPLTVDKFVLKEAE